MKETRKENKTRKNGVIKREKKEEKRDRNKKI